MNLDDQYLFERTMQGRCTTHHVWTVQDNVPGFIFRHHPSGSMIPRELARSLEQKAGTHHVGIEGVQLSSSSIPEASALRMKSDSSFWPITSLPSR
jgi:hypothetical protein